MRTLITLFMLSFSVQALEVKQVGDIVYWKDGTNCVAWSAAWLPVNPIASESWTLVTEASKQYGWPTPTAEQQAQCTSWTVKTNTRRTDGARPIRNVITDKRTGQYIPKNTPCGERASLSYRIYWRLVPGGMAVCEK